MAVFSKRRTTQFSGRPGQRKKSLSLRSGPKQRVFRRWQYLRRKLGSGPIFGVFGMVLVFLLVYGLFFSPFLRIRQVAVKMGGEGTDLEEVALEQEVSRDVLGENLLLIRKKDLYNLLDDVTVREVEIKKEWPKRLTVRIERRTAQAVLKDSSGNLFLVDEEGIVFGRTQKEDLPVIYYPAKDLSVGQKISSREVNFVLYLLSSVNDAQLVVESVQAGGIVHLKIQEGPKVILNPEENAVEKMISMVEEFKRQGKDVAKIDLRFQNPVVEYSE